MMKKFVHAHTVKPKMQFLSWKRKVLPQQIVIFGRFTLILENINHTQKDGKLSWNHQARTTMLVLKIADVIFQYFNIPFLNKKRGIKSIQKNDKKWHTIVFPLLTIEKSFYDFDR